MRDNQLIKALQLFASKKEARPALRCAHIENGVLSITNSHVLIQKPVALPDFTIDLFNLKPFTETYPDTSRLFSDTKELNALPLEKDDVSRIFMLAKTFKKSGTQIDITTNDDNKVTLKEKATNSSITLDAEATEAINVSVSGETLFAIFTYLNLQVTSYLGVTTTIYFRDAGNVAPIQFEQETADGIKTKMILAPLRVY